MNTALIVDIASFFGLFAISLLVRSRFRHRGYSTTAAGGIVMAFGIFTAFALTALPFYTPLLGRLVTIEVLVIWLFLGWSYLLAAINGHFRMHLAHSRRRFAIGTWVAGTAVPALLAVRAVPEAPLFGETLTLVAVAIYIPYVAIFVRGYYEMLHHPQALKANGIVLLATVSTESILIALDSAFPGALPIEVVYVLLAIDAVFLCTGLALIARHYIALRSYALAVEWKNSNCIIHGAVSISGLALVVATGFAPDILIGVWITALVLFAVVETIEVIRMIERESRRGLRLGLFVYDASQWTRNFTYGMFYAFTLALYHHLGATHSAENEVWRPVLGVIAAWGQYVVFAFLLIEMAIFFRARLYRYHLTSRNVVFKV